MIRRKNYDAVHPYVLALSDPGSPLLEIYRRMYRKILFLQQQRNVRSICITSARGSEGKTLTGINLALAMAEDPSRKTALVDCDFRRPQVAGYLGLPLDSGGLEQVVRGEKGLRDVVVPFSGKINLHVFPTSPLEGDLYPLLYQGRLTPMFDELKDAYDFVVVDSPPILPILDQQFLSALLDAVLLVVRAGQTPREVIQTALESVDTMNLIGIVFNGTEERFSGYYPYGYEYRYRYKQPYSRN
ncbi:MAG: CpsD/CapB family tyrosine-protein kinase [bacterium]